MKLLVRQAIPILALQRIDKAIIAQARERVRPGEYQGEATLRLEYKIGVAPSTSRRTPVAVPWERIALAALAALAPEEQARAIARGLTGPAIEPAPAGLAAVLDPWLAGAREAAPRISCAGPVTGTAEVEILPGLPGAE